MNDFSAIFFAIIRTSWPYLQGLILGLLTAEIYRRIRIYINYKNIDMEGVWGEKIRQSTDRKISVGIIYFDKSTKVFKYNGTCYLDDGTPYSHWQTMVSHFDSTQDRLFYIFSAYREENPGTADYGFGVIHLAKHGRKLIPIDGYFSSPSIDGGPRAHSMFRIDFPYDRDKSGNQLIEYLKKSDLPKIKNGDE